MSKKQEKDIDKRELRKKKRKRARRTAFVALILILALVGTGIYFGSQFAMNYFADKKAQEEAEIALQQQLAEQEAREAEALAQAQLEAELQEQMEAEEPTPEPTPEPTAEELQEEMIDAMISQMTLEEKVAGIFIVTPESLVGQGNVTKAGEGTKEALEKYAIGGVVYDKKNIQSEQQLTDLVNNTVEYSRYPLFIAVEENGGDQSPVQSALKLDKIDSQLDMAAAGDESVIYNNYKNMGTYLSKHGFNLVLGPSGDILTDSDKSKVGKNSFGKDQNVTSNYVNQAINGLHDAGINTCVKHFPGEGGADADPKNAMSATTSSVELIKGYDMVPFKMAAEAQTDMIMVSHESAEVITGDSTPCSMSKEVMTDIIRAEMLYDGVIITAAMNVPSITEYYTDDEVAIKAVKAGADMILAPSNFEAAYNAVLAAVQDGSISEERLNDALKRIYKIKYKNTLDN